MRIPSLALCSYLTSLLACATAPPKTAAKTETVLPPPRVEKMREPLEVTPLELHFSGLRGAAGVTESVAVKNTGSEPVQVSDVRVVGLKAETFKIVNVPLLPTVLPPGGAFSFSVAFEPAADADLGVHHARVRLVRSEDDDGPPCDLTGLVTLSRTEEAPLAQILDALGYDVDVGGTSLALPAGAAGDQVDVPTFQRAKPGSVGYYLIARYSPDEDAQFGYYVVEGAKPAVRGIASASKAHNQTLNPELNGDSQGSFDLGETAFGLYLKAGPRTLYSDGRLNAGTPKAAARVYPLRSRGRTPVPDAYVVAFDADGDNDFQDYVFLLWNVKSAK
jgi:hypothetical protein